MHLAAPSRPPASPPDPARSTDRREQALRKAAADFETAFIAQMLQQTGFGAPRSGLAAGQGQEAFSTFLTEAVATRMSAQGGFGLSEAIFQSLAGRSGFDPAQRAVETETAPT